MLRTILITGDPQLASDAEMAGVSRIMVDLESIGKKERQKSRRTFISTHRPEDISAVRAVLHKAELIVRLNPWHEGSSQEIEDAITRGAQRLMLPMILRVEEFRQFVHAVAGRLPVLPLIETRDSMEHLADILALPEVDEAYIGLNDLHLSLGQRFLFEPLADGLLDGMASLLQQRGIPFGFGGIATIGSGELPAEKIVGEHERLGSSRVILSSRFASDLELHNPEGRRQRIALALEAITACYRKHQQRTDEERRHDHADVVRIVGEIVQRLSQNAT